MHYISSLIISYHQTRGNESRQCSFLGCFSWPVELVLLLEELEHVLLLEELEQVRVLEGLEQVLVLEELEHV